MQLPDASSAVLDIRKLSHYCLSASHPLGRHKSRVFKAALGITNTDAAWLRRALLDGISLVDADELETDEFGTRYGVNITVRRQGRQAVIRTIWIATPKEGSRFVTCWVV